MSLDDDIFEHPDHSPNALKVLKDIIGNPERFESPAFSKAIMRLEDAMERSGYTRADEGGITIETVNHMHNIMVILCDKTLVHVMADTRGNYDYSEFVQNVKHPTKEEMESVRTCIDLELAERSWNMGSRAEREFRRLCKMIEKEKESGIVPEWVQSFVTRIKTLFPWS